MKHSRWDVKITNKQPQLRWAVTWSRLILAWTWSWCGDVLYWIHTPSWKLLRIPRWFGFNIRISWKFTWWHIAIKHQSTESTEGYVGNFLVRTFFVTPLSKLEILNNNRAMCVFYCIGLVPPSCCRALISPAACDPVLGLWRISGRLSLTASLSSGSALCIFSSFPPK